MKKLLLLIPMLLIFTACSIEQVDSSSIDNVIDTILKNANATTNITYKGYKYYLPIDISKIGNNEYNEILYSKDITYYLYVDIVSYYKKIETDYIEDKNAYFSKKIEYGDKSGYIEINKIEDKYFLKIMYNYGDIETYVTEKNLNDTIANSIIILNSIEYNDIIIDTLIGEKAEELETEDFNIFKSQREEGNFLDYVKEYDQYKEVEDDESTISNEKELEILE